MRTALVLISSLVFYSCQQTAPEEKKTTDQQPADSVNRVEPIKNSYHRDSTVDFTARYIAGLPQLSSNGFQKLENTFWKNYAKNTEENWTKLDTQRLTSIRNWQKEEFSGWINDTLPLFYPFSGPDFVHAVNIYPESRKYIFCALEPIIDLPDFEKLAEDNRKLFLNSLDNSLRDIFNKSYFITTHMQEDFKGDKARGVLPVFYVFLVRSGFEILDVKSIGIDKTGKVEDTLLDQKKSEYVKGVRFRFIPRDGDVLKELYYFNVDVSDKGWNRNPGFGIFLDSLGQVNTFVKSASYLMHYSTFSSIRTKVMTISATIFQDDTGIPYSYFKNNMEWKTTLFGEYTKPVKDFGDYVFQDDLDSVYKTDVKILKLPFHLGYHWGDKKQSQQLFIRK